MKTRILTLLASVVSIDLPTLLVAIPDAGPVVDDLVRNRLVLRTRDTLRLP